jgi:phage/plasmid-like protein (TIGR03299 family)
MSHELAIINGKASMAYVGEKPWHGLGQELTANASLETWKKEAGMDWEIKDSPIRYMVDGEAKIYTGDRVLYRSDTGEQLSIVSDQYKVVQPGEVLDFFQDLVSLQGMKLATAGVLYGGRRFWALADTGRAFDVLNNDRVKGMLLLTTSCDGKMATSAMFTSVRVVCNNTLSLALSSDSKSATRVTHRSIFDPTKVKADLGLVDKAWEEFKSNITTMSKIKMSENAAHDFLRKLLEREGVPAEKQPYTVDRDVAAIMKRMKDGMGTNKTEGTLWGVLNSVTEFVDHDGRARIPDHALWGSWFGKGANLKSKAYENALALI